jgi:hypothetical protein
MTYQPPIIITPAKRGDLVIAAVPSSYTTADGNTIAHTIYYAAKVTAVTRNGLVKQASRPDCCPPPHAFGEEFDFSGCGVGSQTQFRITIDELLIALGDDSRTESLSDMSAVLRKYNGLFIRRRADGNCDCV